MTSKRPTPNRRRGISLDQEAKIEAFSRSAETLTANSEPPASEEGPVSVSINQKKEGIFESPKSIAKSPKNRSFTFKMTEETLKQLQERKIVEDRSIQWIFDNILLPALDK